MRIEPRENREASARRLAVDIARARELDPVSDPVCCAYCPDLSENVRCHRHCPSAAARLSTDARYPVEPLVAPLVFELKRLGAFHPCWSCEGHNDAQGRLNKKPAVWFYANSVVHIRALASALDRMLHRGRLKTQWQVAVTHTDRGNPDVTFSLEPAGDSHAPLDLLQSDLRTMADDLQSSYRAACDDLAATC